MPDTVYEIDQATGAQAGIAFASENTWGNVAAAPKVKQLNVVAGESLDENIAIYRSSVIRPDRMKNRSVRGSTRPGGNVPFELAPKGVNQLLYHLFGWLASDAGSGSGPFTHVLKGHNGTTAFPQGFSLEKSFNDLAIPTFAGILGCRANSMTLNFNVDQSALGTFDIQGREWFIDDESIFDGDSPEDMTADPYTSVDITVYEGSSLLVLGTARTLALTLANNMFLENNVLGSRFRANLKPGTRDTTFTGTFLFNNTDLYDKAVSGDDTKVQIVASNGIYSHAFLLPAVQFLPQNSSPKISTDGPLTISLNGEGNKDDVLGTDIQCTITCPESDITGLVS